MTPKTASPARRRLGNTDLEIAPLVFGGNAFGWTIDETTAFTLLDRLADAGIHAIDTADVYSNWVPGLSGGESETTIGKWFRSRPHRRADTVLITKVGLEMAPGKRGLSAKYIVEAVEASLTRLQTDVIDLYFSHVPDKHTPVEETLRAYDTLIRQGKVRAIGASNHSAEQLQEALQVSVDDNLPRYEVLQPLYNLYDRAGFEGPVRDLAIAESLGVIVFYGLASGFLSGKYRSKADLGQSKRGADVEKYLNPRGLRILDALDMVAAAHNAKPAEVALAWLIARDGVTAPIASATSVAQVDSLIRATQLTLSPADMETLNTASALEPVA
ncbi:MAG: aldo/keto reductase [Sphingomonadaceae bacterium]